MATADLVGCPHCGKPISYSREFAGQIIGCPHCGGRLQMPGTPPSRGAAPPAPPTPSRAPTFGATDDSPRRKPDREPWYYGFIEGYSKLLLWIAVLSVIGAGLLVGYVGVKPFTSTLIAEQEARGVVIAILVWIGYALMLVASLIGSVFVVASALLAVDAARNLREMRMRMPKE